VLKTITHQGVSPRVVPTLTFKRLFALVILRLGRRHLVWFAVTRYPTAEWLAQQLVETFPWDTAPAYLVRDNDGAYGPVFARRLRAMGIRDRPIAPRSPWQNAYVERLIGTVRRDCLDHVLIFGEEHLRRVLAFMPSITIKRVLIWHWTKTRLSGEPYNARPHYRDTGPVRIASSLRARI
jgi:transposase InsO family protein